MKLTRRGFLKIAGATGTAGLLAQPSAALGSATGSENAPGANESAVLVDTTKCVGCRACEAACSEQNGNPPPSAREDVFDSTRKTDENAFTVVNRGPNRPDGSHRFAKSQCMHCVAPACASACPVKALEKQPEGPVTYRADRCMGCRYCMVACPFGVPKYEYQSAAPRVRKCTFCFDRQKEGKAPACASVCPTGALTFGRRADLLEEAKTRIYSNPGKYERHVYGENEAGGTNWLYLADVSFSKLGFPSDIEKTSYPDLIKGALGAPPFVMTLWPPLLMGLYTFAHRRHQAASKLGAGHEDSHGDAHGNGAHGKES
jgi:Fe-S-cluster-containing dehydrogenase component